MNHARKRILISDCDTEVLITLEHVLEDEGFDTTTACRTDETLQLLQTQEFDLVLAADHPPELDCERVLREAQTHNTPVLALENRARHPFAGAFLLSRGARGIVHKWEHQEVHDAVHGVLFGPCGEMAKSAVAATGQIGVS
ncbi:MAG: hypothetical protein ACXVZX_08660 [Terriglobales bacterium]